MTHRLIAPFAQVSQAQYQPVAIDFEFSRLPLPNEDAADWVGRVEILSLGLAPGGKHRPLYAISGRISRQVSHCAPWTQENVLPLLHKRPHQLNWNTDAQLRHALMEHLVAIEGAEGRPVAVIADWPGDLLLFRRCIAPLSMKMALACPEDDAARPWVGRIEEAREGLIRHNALDDAIWLRRVLGFEGRTAPAPARVI